LSVQILEKNLEPIFPNNFATVMLFPGLETLSAEKNTIATFFGLDEVVL
jgi:hypothetical protein